MISWSVEIRNAAGRDVATVETAKSSANALTKAIRRYEQMTGQRWYAVRCHPRGF